MSTISEVHLDHRAGKGSDIRGTRKLFSKLEVSSFECSDCSGGRGRWVKGGRGVLGGRYKVTEWD